MATEKLNVVFVVVDDLRTEIGSYTNGTVGFTPNFDAFAKKSVQFNRAYAQVALCGPSRMSMFSGRTARSLDYFQHNLADVLDYDILSRSPIPSMPKYFQKNGYSTAAAGKVFHRDETMTTEFQASKISNSNPCPCSESLGTCPKMICTVTEAMKTTLADSGMMTWGLSQLTTFSKSSKPFFLSLGIRKPHLPYEVPITHINKIKAIYGSSLEKMPLPVPKAREDAFSVNNYWCDAMDGYLLSTVNALASTGTATRSFRSPSSPNYYEEHEGEERVQPIFFSENDFTNGVYGSNYASSNDTSSGKRQLGSSTISTNLGADPISDDLIRQIKMGYFAAVSWADEVFGMLDAKLTSLGLYNKTVVVVVGDNGFNLGEQGQYCKNNNFEAGTKVPLYIRHPKGSLNIKRQNIVSLVDLYPTVLDLAMPGQRESDSVLNSNLQGNSFADLVSKSVVSRPIETIFSEIQDIAFSGIYRCYDESTALMVNCATTADVNIVGYSVRTQNFRYTEWRSAGSTSSTRYTFTDDNLLYSELYDHSNDSEVNTIEEIGKYYVEFDKVENENIMAYLQADSVKRAGLTMPRAIAKNGVDYITQLVNVAANLLNAHYSCTDLDCVPITELLPPSTSPTHTPTSGPFSPTSTKSPTPGTSPSTKPPTPGPSPSTKPPTAETGTPVITTSFPTGSPIFGDNSGVETKRPTLKFSDASNNPTGFAPGMSAAISIVIILACVTIAVIVVVYIQVVKKQRRKNAPKLKMRESSWRPVPEMKR